MDKVNGDIVLGSALTSIKVKDYDKPKVCPKCQKSRLIKNYQLDGKKCAKCRISIKFSERLYLCNYCGYKFCESCTE